MVYNAMKLFMEVNPQLFDDCSHDYAESQKSAPQRQQARQMRWDQLAELAQARQSGNAERKAPTATQSKLGSPLRTDDSDPVNQESSRRMEALRLQDDGAPSRERRPKEHERSSQTSVR